MSQTDALDAAGEAATSTHPDAARRPGRLRRVLRRSVQVVGVVVLLIGVYLGIEQLIGNFHTVVPGELYRSAQIDARELAGLQKDYGIKTVINLRGASNHSWYQDEVAESSRLGLTHIDFGLSAGRELTQPQVEQLIALMRDAPKPILVHCRGGADRSGIASALYVAAIAKEGEMAAEWQLSLFYGHFPFPFAPAWAMDETFERIEPWLGFPNS
ncbi:dual specificity protein phosphatase family protein [Ancylobacter sp. Lp-2]|uniref:dual specificity protein phosphatase family protein n=1 Tax=Ancylobacter sp. Lp-2 TaxID=2881339 RepID=UPI001E3F6488|nr:dual specificity protein phosphatase family protein [Ancylobacter sp. Lp-2]MCB4771410.1 dual specificity protein phosphatase family protein [Ancylobacter sp. Lp-2]